MVSRLVSLTGSEQQTHEGAAEQKGNGQFHIMKGWSVVMGCGPSTDYGIHLQRAYPIIYKRSADVPVNTISAVWTMVRGNAQQEAIAVEADAFPRAKIVQTESNTKQACLFLLPRCSLSYLT